MNFDGVSPDAFKDKLIKSDSRVILACSQILYKEQYSDSSRRGAPNIEESHANTTMQFPFTDWFGLVAKAVWLLNLSHS